MATVKVYGSGHDIVIVEGGGLTEEFYPGSRGYGDDEYPISYLAFSDGTVLSIQYGVGGGIWRVFRLAAGSASYSKVEAIDEDSEYSDLVTLEGDITWVVFGDGISRAKKSNA